MSYEMIKLLGFVSYCFTDLYAWVRIGRLKIEWIKKASEK